MTKQEYYEHLCQIGIPDLLAATMANQSCQQIRNSATESIKAEVYAFSYWQNTIEGSDFWSDLVDCLK